MITEKQISDLLDLYLNPIATDLAQIKSAIKDINLSLDTTEQLLTNIDMSLNSIENTFSELDILIDSFNRHCHNIHHQLQLIH